MLQCLMVALRPLRVEEAAELLAFEFIAHEAVPKYRTDWRPSDQVEAILSTCSSLISIVNDNDIQVVQFSHFSVKEFLISDRLGVYSQYQILLRPAHTILAQACLGCLLHLDGNVDKNIVKGLPLAEYAAKHWVMHARFEDVASCVKDGMETLFDCDKPHFGAWVGIYNMDEESSSESPFKIPTPLYYSSLCGFPDLVKHLSVKYPQQVNAMGGKYKFPLLAALVRKHIGVADILLKHDANVDIRGLKDRTPLHEAIANVGMVQSLLDKDADVNCRQDDLRTPLHLAASYGQLEVARLLVGHKADVDSQDNKGETPLHAATFQGRLEIAQVLLDQGVNANLRTEGGETVLHIVSRGKYKSEEHRVGIARLLLEYGVDVDARDKNSFTLLHWAASTGRVKIAQILLDHGANAKLETEEGETALHIVSRGRFFKFSNLTICIHHEVDSTPKSRCRYCTAITGIWCGRERIKESSPRLTLVNAMLYNDHVGDGHAQSHAMFPRTTIRQYCKAITGARCGCECTEGRRLDLATLCGIQREARGRTGSS